MKSLNIKIPMTTAHDLSERGQLNPEFMNYFIKYHLLKPIPAEPIDELSFNYTFKIDEDVHRSVKLLAMTKNLAMNEMIGRILKKYY